ncbi:MAG: hypothetical protein P8L30_15195 [Longimicrobiales bacterium]|nr:hypothetical protein [Longimicrobiales bacterium]
MYPRFLATGPSGPLLYGVLTDLRLRESSGHQALDQAGQAMAG